jgi:hypothetical protein
MARVNNNSRVSTQSSSSQQRVDISTLSSNSSTRRSGSNNRVTTGNRNTATNASRQTPQGSGSSRRGQSGSASPTSTTNRAAANDATRNVRLASAPDARSTGSTPSSASGTQNGQAMASLGSLWKTASTMAQTLSTNLKTLQTDAAKFNTVPSTAQMPAHKEIAGLSNHRENAGGWANDAYKFAGKPLYMTAADRAAGRAATVGEVGCTMTAYSNAASVVKQKNPSAAVPTPNDANQRTQTFNSAMSGTKWTPLTTEKHSVFNSTSEKGRTTVFDSSGKATNSPAGKALLEKVYDRVAKGEPVVLGMTGNSKGGVRHTIVVTGIVSGGKRGDASALVVRDQWRGQDGAQGSGAGGNIPKPTAAQKDAEKTTLDKTMTTSYRGVYTQVDMAMAASAK